MNNLEELQPCPFCGGKAHLLTSNGSFLIECSVCLTDFLNGPVGIGWYRSEKDAAADWNDRPSERALIAQLEAAQKENGDLVMSLNVANDSTSIWKARAKKAEAELSAANEKLSTAVEFPDSDIAAVSHIAHWYSEKQCEAWVAGVEFSKKQIKAAGFAVEGSK
ncbi:TPA: Lar family restriction alleviation protein [Yersinia enterocolitica]|nr:Lar family restriction alleviation protein [Yersinia enterocolitica]